MIPESAEQENERFTDQDNRFRASIVEPSGLQFFELPGKMHGESHGILYVKRCQ